MENLLLCGDACSQLKELADESIDLVVTSPPYDNLRKYNGTGDSWNHEKFKAIADELKRVLKPGGVIVWNVNDKTEGGSKTGTSFRQALYFMEIGLNLNDTMIWCLSGGTKVYAKINDKPYSMVIGDMVRLQNSDIKLWDGDKWVNVLGWRENKETDNTIERITLRSGERIFCSKNHRWILDNGEEVLTSDLKVGDILKRVKLPDETNLPSILTDDVLWLIGLYIAEGSHSGDIIQISLNSDEEKWMPRIKKTIENLCGTMHYHIYGNSLHCLIESRVFEAILKTYIGGRTAKDKHFKNICWQLPNKALKQIMCGYLDGDGHFDSENNRFRLGFTNNVFLEADLRTLAARLGAELTLHPYRTWVKCLNREYPSYKGEWRWVKTNHHNTKNRSEIIEVKTIKKRKDTTLWDIEVDSEEHLFSLSSGILTHNCKTNPMPQVKQPRYIQQFEYMFIFSKGKPKTFNPIMRKCKSGGKLYNSTAKNIDGESGRHKLVYNVNDEMVEYNVWEMAVAQNREVYEINGKQIKHPAVFPYELPYKHIKSWTNEGDVVLDPFAGSGTTLLAARDLNRKWLGIEMNEDYCEMIRMRLQR